MIIPLYTWIHYYTFRPIPLYLYIYHYDYIRFWTIAIYYYRTQITLFGIIWCLICGILIIIGSLLVLALIPLYLSNRSVEVARSNETRMLSLTSVFHLSYFFKNILETDIWTIEYYTDYPYASTRAIIQANKQALSQSVSQTLMTSKIEKKI